LKLSVFDAFAPRGIASRTLISGRTKRMGLHNKQPALAAFLASLHFCDARSLVHDIDGRCLFSCLTLRGRVVGYEPGAEFLASLAERHCGSKKQ
jgi:hypothetical protein